MLIGFEIIALPITNYPRLTDLGNTLYLDSTATDLLDLFEAVISGTA